MLVDQYLYNKLGVLGTIVHVDVRGQKSLTAASGFFDISRTRPIKPHDKFFIGSITKVFTATLVHQLIERGQVQLDGPLIDYLRPEWATLLEKAEYGRDITVGHALSHRSGLFDVMSFLAFLKYGLPDPAHRSPRLTIAARIPDHRTALFKPGDSFEYGNVNYLLLGSLIDTVTQRSYKTVLNDKLLSKIPLQNTFVFEGPHGSTNEDIAHGYLSLDGELHDLHHFDMTPEMAVGAMVSTTDDLIKFLRALVSGALFKEETTFRKMSGRPEGNESFAFGIEVVDYPDLGLCYRHAGGTGGTSSILAHFPEHQVTICMCHTFDGSAARLPPCVLMKLIMRELFGLPHDGPGPGSLVQYSELDLKIQQVEQVETYTVNEKVYVPEEGNGLFLVRLEGTSPRSGEIQYTPWMITLDYQVDNRVVSAACLGIGHILNTKSGRNESWVRRDEANQKTIAMSVTQNKKTVLYGLFEAPTASSDIEVVAR